MSARGVFAVDRGIWDDVDFADEAFSEREAFLWLVSEAAWRPTKARVGSATIDLARGQCAFSTRFMATKWKWSESRVRRFFARLEKSEIIDAVADAKATKVTIRKYDRFQRVGLVSDADGDADPTQQRRTGDAGATQRSETGKQLNSHLPLVDDRPHSKREAKATRLSSDWQPDAEDLIYAKAQGINDGEVFAEAEKFRDHWIAKPNPDGRKTDWHAVWRTWCRNSVKWRPNRPPPPSGGPRGGNGHSRKPTMGDLARGDLFRSEPDGSRDCDPHEYRTDAADARVSGFAGPLRQQDRDDPRGNVLDLRRANGW